MTVKEKNQYYIDLIESRKSELNAIHLEWIEFCRINNIINEFSCTPKSIIKSVCNCFGISDKEIKQKSRRCKFLYPRYIAIYLIFIEFNEKRYNDKTREKKDGFLSLKDIAGFFNLNHSTIINSKHIVIDTIENNGINKLLADYLNDYNNYIENQVVLI